MPQKRFFNTVTYKLHALPHTLCATMLEFLRTVKFVRNFVRQFEIKAIIQFILLSSSPYPELNLLLYLQIFIIRKLLFRCQRVLNNKIKLHAKTYQKLVKPYYIRSKIKYISWIIRCQLYRVKSFILLVRL